MWTKQYEFNLLIDGWLCGPTPHPTPQKGSYLSFCLRIHGRTYICVDVLHLCASMHVQMDEQLTIV
jgi:hypothetical protein